MVSRLRCSRCANQSIMSLVVAVCVPLPAVIWLSRKPKRQPTSINTVGGQHRWLFAFLAACYELTLILCFLVLLLLFVANKFLLLLRIRQFCSVRANKLELNTSVVQWRNPDTRTIPTQTENVAVPFGRRAWFDCALLTSHERRDINVRTELNWKKLKRRPAKLNDRRIVLSLLCLFCPTPEPALSGQLGSLDSLQFNSIADMCTLLKKT